MAEKRFTLAGLHEYQEEIKKSRFIAVAAPLAEPDGLNPFLSEHADPGATHNCWAWRLGNDYRFFDDGEPGGTAGRPILQAIEGQQCDRVVVLVKRWFGGVKLGTGGLVRAYGGVAAQCLRLADKLALIDEVELLASCPFAEISRVQAHFSEFSVRVLADDYDANGVQWHLSLPANRQDEFTELFTNFTRGQGLVQVIQADE